LGKGSSFFRLSFSASISDISPISRRLPPPRNIRDSSLWGECLRKSWCNSVSSGVH
jgi:hypothetical protein